MNDLILRLDSKIRHTNSTRRAAMTSFKRKLVTAYGIELPDITNNTPAMFVNTSTNKLYKNCDTHWENVNQVEGTIPAVDGKHIIFIDVPVIFKKLFHYASVEMQIEIELPGIVSQSLSIDEIIGYNLYACYVEVIEND